MTITPTMTSMMIKNKGNDNITNKNIDYNKTNDGDVYEDAMSNNNQSNNINYVNNNTRVISPLSGTGNCQ